MKRTLNYLLMTEPHSSDVCNTSTAPFSGHYRYANHQQGSVSQGRTKLKPSVTSPREASLVAPGQEWHPAAGAWPRFPWEAEIGV